MLQPEGHYRYSLARHLDPLHPDDAKRILWIMLNPSTADEVMDDPTIRKVKEFSRRWGYKNLRVVNLYGTRSTDPDALYTSSEDFSLKVGTHNDFFINVQAQIADIVVCAWGSHRLVRRRSYKVLSALRKKHDLYCICTNKDGNPKHPLYAKYTDAPVLLEEQ